MAILPPDPVFCFREDMGRVLSLSFSLRGNDFVSHLLAGTEKGVVYFWDLETNRLQHKQQMASDSIQSLHCIDFNIITQEKQGVVKLWSPNKSTYEVQKTVNCGSGYCKSILISDTLIIPHDQDYTSIDVLNVNTFDKIRTLSLDGGGGADNLGHVMALEAVAVGGASCVMAGYESGDVVLWDLGSFEVRGRLKVMEHLTSLTFDPATRRAVAGGAANVLKVFTVGAGLEMAVKCEVSITNEGCSVVKLRPDKKILVAGGWDGKIRLFSWKTLRLLAVLSEHKESITDVEFSPCPVNYWKSNIMAAGSSDGVISLWNVYN